MSNFPSDANQELRPWLWVAALNGLGAVIGGIFAVIGSVNPGFQGGSVNTLVHIYAGAYAVRAVPIAIVLVGLLARPRRTPALVPLLLVAGLAQGGDAVLGAIHGQPAMLAGGGAYAVIHLATALWLSRASSAKSV